MKTLQAYIKLPESDPKVIRIRNRGGDIIKLLDGGYYNLTIELQSGKRIVLFYQQLALQKRSNYNFTVCPTKEKRTWIDILGPVVVMDEAGGDLELSEAEMKSLFVVPYE